MPLIPAFLTGIFVSVAKFIFWILGYVVVKLFLLIGLSIATYKGFDALVDKFKDSIIDVLSNSSSAEYITTTLGLIKFDVAVSILLSSLVLKYTIEGITSMSKFVLKGDS